MISLFGNHHGQHLSLELRCAPPHCHKNLKQLTLVPLSKDGAIPFLDQHNLFK